MKIAPIKKEKPSSAKPISKTSPKVAMNSGHRRPSSKDRIVPVTTPQAKRMIMAFDQRLATAL
jgi:hypothetical protein